MTEEDNQLHERRQAELEFVASAYSPEEAWCEIEIHNDSPRVVRRLPLSDCCKNPESIGLLLKLSMPPQYPEEAPLEISFALEKGPTHLWNTAQDVAPSLVESCRQVAQELIGQEAVFAVLSQAEAWVQEQWSSHLLVSKPVNPPRSTDTSAAASKTGSSNNVLGRRLIYSHHIISKIKRGNMKNLAAHCELTVSEVEV
jgi:RWD domain